MRPLTPASVLATFRGGPGKRIFAPKPIPESAGRAVSKPRRVKWEIPSYSSEC